MQEHLVFIQQHKIIQPSLADLEPLFLHRQHVLFATEICATILSEKAIAAFWCWFANHCSEVHDCLVVLAGLLFWKNLLGKQRKLFFAFSRINWRVNVKYP